MTFAPMRSELETERLLLQPWVDVDVATYQALVAERGEGTPTADDVEQRLRMQRERYATDGLALLALRRKAERDVIGYCGLVVGRSTPEEPELAYELFRRAHGAGYATEAARAVVTAARDTGRSRLWATVRSWNHASLRVLDKLEFSRERTTSDDKGEIIWYTRELLG
jgi:RimJ/RimL family protein N-acetyltransferase